MLTGWFGFEMFVMVTREEVSWGGRRALAGCIAIVRWDGYVRGVGWVVWLGAPVFGGCRELAMVTTGIWGLAWSFVHGVLVFMSS